MYVVYSIKDQIHCTIMNYMYYLPHLFYSIFEVILFFTQHLIGQRHDQTWCNDQTRTEKIVFLEKEKGNFVNCWREKFTTNAKNDKNEIKTQVIYLYVCYRPGLEDCSSRPGIVSRSLSRGGFLSLSFKRCCITK